MKRVYLVGSLHGLHKKNEDYRFEDLYNYVRKINPDVIAVEIRKEDLNLSGESLSEMYPKEMIDILMEHKDKKTVVGFDWLGREVEGKSIPKGYFKEFKYAILSGELMGDEEHSNILKMLNIVDDKKMKMLMSGDIHYVHHEFYDHAVDASREQFKEVFKDTKYIDILNFDLERNENINKNIKKIVDKYESETVMIITGRDHVGHIKKSFEDNTQLKIVTPYDI